MSSKAPIHLVNKASELDVLCNALASYLSYDKNLLLQYKYWSFDHVITHSLLLDTKLLLKYLKKLSNIHCKKERYKLLNNIQTITNNIYSYCSGLEYHNNSNKDYLGIYRKELNQFTFTFLKWARFH